jgi:hypothetical protein
MSDKTDFELGWVVDLGWAFIGVAWTIVTCFILVICAMFDGLQAVPQPPEPPATKNGRSKKGAGS